MSIKGLNRQMLTGRSGDQVASEFCENLTCEARLGGRSGHEQTHISRTSVFLQKDKAAKANAAASKASWKQRSGSVIGKYLDGKAILGR